MEKLKVGDTVRLKEGLSSENPYGCLYFYEWMRFEGERQIDTIMEKTDSCRIGMYYYSFEMLERVSDEN